MLAVEAKRLSARYVDCIKLVIRFAGQFVQMDTRIAESRNRSPPKGRTIGESLKEVIFTSHTSPPKPIGFYTEIMLTTANLIVKFIISIEKIGFSGICDIALPEISRRRPLAL
jgi:hypothetical protein